MAKKKARSKDDKSDAEKLIDAVVKDGSICQDWKKKHVFHIGGKGYLHASELRVIADELDRLNAS